MKKIYTILIALMFVLTISEATATCTSGFTWHQTANNTIAFTNTSTGPTTPTFYWHFGDGDNDHVTNPTHVFDYPGTYWVCVTMYDDNHHACDTYCDSVVVTGIHHCHLEVHGTTQIATCDTCHDGWISLSLTNGTPPYTFLWNDGSTNHYRDHLAPGTYWVCVTDSNNCHSCDTFHVGNHHYSGTCHANFSLHADTTHPHHYWAVDASSGAAPISYLWTWGDNSSDTISHPGHGYAAAGYYTICLYISDGHGCIDSMCISHQLNRMASASILSVDVVDAITTGIDNPTNGQLFGIYPNPVTDKVTIQSNGESFKEISIADVLGQTIYKETLDATSKIIDMSKFQSGIYVIQIKTDNSIITQKIMK